MLDEAEAARIRQHWNGVIGSFTAIRTAQMAGMSGGMMPSAVLKLADVAYCMLVFMAFSTLEQFLGARESEIGLTKKKRSQGLKKLIRESKKLRNGVAALEWADDKLVDEGRELRDKLAHHHLTEKRAITLTYVKAVQDELAGWLDGLEMIDFSEYTKLKRWKT